MKSLNTLYERDWSIHRNFTFNKGVRFLTPLLFQALFDVFKQIFAGFETDAEADSRIRD